MASNNQNMAEMAMLWPDFEGPPSYRDRRAEAQKRAGQSLVVEPAQAVTQQRLFDRINRRSRNSHTSGAFDDALFQANRAHAAPSQISVHTLDENWRLMLKFKRERPLNQNHERRTTSANRISVSGRPARPDQFHGSRPARQHGSRDFVPAFDDFRARKPLRRECRTNTARDEIGDRPCIPALPVRPIGRRFTRALHPNSFAFQQLASRD